MRVDLRPRAHEQRQLVVKTLWRLAWQAIEVLEVVDWGRSFAASRIAHEADLSPRAAADALAGLVAEGLAYRQGDRYSLTAAGLRAGYRLLDAAGQLPVVDASTEAPA